MWKLLLPAAALLIVCAPLRAAESDEKLVRELVVILKDHTNPPGVRATAIRSLEALGWTGRTALPELIKLLDDADERRIARDSVGAWPTMGPYYYAIEAIGLMGSSAREAVPSLIRAKGAVPAFDQTVDNALRNLLQPSDPNVFSLLGSLRDTDPAVRLAAAKALRRYPADLAIVEPALREAAKGDLDADVRRVAKESADEVVKAEAGRLAQLLKDKDANVRLLAARALGRMGATARDAVPALTEAAAKDVDPDVRFVAAGALKKIQAKN